MTDDQANTEAGANFRYTGTRRIRGQRYPDTLSDNPYQK